MPKYKVTLSDGRTLVVDANRAPTADEVLAHLNRQKAPERAAAPPAAPAAPEGKSVGGFLQNALSSTGKLISDTASGAASLAGMTPEDVGRAVEGGVRLAGNALAAPFSATQQQALEDKLRPVADAVKARYGSPGAVGETLYTDPAGALADVSTVLSAGSLAAARAPRLAAQLGRAAAATDPLAPVLRGAAKATEYGTAAAVRPLLKPGKALRKQQHGALEIERTALREGAVTARSAARKKSASMNQADAAAAAVTGRVPNARITDMPDALASAGKGLDTQGDLDRLAQLETEAMGSLPAAGATASELLDKRRYLDRELNNAYRAQERGGVPTGIRQKGQQEMVGNIRRELRDMAPGVAAADDQTRRLFAVESAIEDAGLRAGDLPMGGFLAGAGAMGAGIPGAGAIGGGFALGRTFPQIPLALGSPAVRGTAAVANAAGTTPGRMAGQFSRLFELSPLEAMLLERQIQESSNGQ